VGGNYRKEAGSFIGPVAEENLKLFNIGTAFLGTTGFSREGDFSSQNLIEAQLKKMVVKRAERTVILTDRSKLGAQAFAVFARAGDIDVLVMDNSADLPDLSGLRAEVILVEPPTDAGTAENE
jgi:DeoR/GlpR family transcriptional regulator of sugar metabolism